MPKKTMGRHAATCPKCGTELWIVNGQVKWYTAAMAKKKNDSVTSHSKSRVESEDSDETDNETDDDSDEEELFP